MIEAPLTALVLGGGGARAAYQAGVLRALMRVRRERHGQRIARVNPFGIICGTSAGAINAAALACQADRFEAAVEVVARVWQDLSADQVYRADALGVMRSGARWLTMLSAGWAFARWRRGNPRSLLDNAPLAGLLERMVPMERLPAMLAKQHLHALAITASSYSSGEHHTFYSAARPVAPWLRSMRLAVPATLGHEHVLASSALPFVFPAHRLEVDGRVGWFGDGAMRNTAPLSPAIHLGARRVLVVGSGRMQEPAARPVDDPGYPSLAQIAGNAMSSIFLDTLTMDVERMGRINHTLSLLPDQARAGTLLRPIDSLVISPSQRLDDIAARHLDDMSRPVRTLLRAIGVGGEGPQASGSALASYLLFEAPFTRELIALGEADVEALRDEVLAFFGW